MKHDLLLSYKEFDDSGGIDISKKPIHTSSFTIDVDIWVDASSKTNAHTVMG